MSESNKCKNNKKLILFKSEKIKFEIILINL